MTVTAGEALQFFGTIIGGGVAVAIINCANDRWKWRKQRKAQLEDRAEEKGDRTEEISDDVEKFKKEEEKTNAEFQKKLEGMQKCMEETQKMIQTLADSQKIIYLDRIRFLGQSYIEKEEITFDDRRFFHMMHEMYHNGLKGNGDADLIVAAVDRLPLRSLKKGEVGLNVHHDESNHHGDCAARCCDSNSDIASQGK